MVKLCQKIYVDEIYVDQQFLFTKKTIALTTLTADACYNGCAPEQYEYILMNLRALKMRTMQRSI